MNLTFKANARANPLSDAQMLRHPPGKFSPGSPRQPPQSRPAHASPKGTKSLWSQYFPVIPNSTTRLMSSEQIFKGELPTGRGNTMNHAQQSVLNQNQTDDVGHEWLVAEATICGRNRKKHRRPRGNHHRADHKASVSTKSRTSPGTQACRYGRIERSVIGMPSWPGGEGRRRRSPGRRRTASEGLRRSTA